MRISDWSSDVCSSDLAVHTRWGKLPWADLFQPAIDLADKGFGVTPVLHRYMTLYADVWKDFPEIRAIYYVDGKPAPVGTVIRNPAYAKLLRDVAARGADAFYTGANAQAIVKAVTQARSEEHTSELQPLMRSSYAVFCLKKKK